ncbi:MAG: ABC transporter permease [Actinomycetota bacterium]|nr:ABC transporter permease [Actinomycetota bacterium]
MAHAGHAAALRGQVPARAFSRERVVAAAVRVGIVTVTLLALWGLWELYRFIWVETGWTWPFPVNDTTLPHVHTIFKAFGEQSRSQGPLLISVLLHAAWFTGKEALVGFLMGASIGFVIAVALVHSRLMQRAFLPYIVASQTIPMLAVAPMVVVWLQAGWLSVAVIAAYLTFFPVAINTLRGLQSADPRAHELLRTYAASRWNVLWHLRVPASLPYLFSALKVSATASVVGAIIGELPSSIEGGLGGAILNFNQYYSLVPANLWATNLIAAALGIAFFLAVVIAEKLVVRRAPAHTA